MAFFVKSNERSTNITDSNIGQLITGAALNSVASIAGVPQIAQIGASIIGSTTKFSPYFAYAVPPLASANRNGIFAGIETPDLRLRKGFGAQSITMRIDGTSAATRKSIKAGIIAGLNISTLGTYSVFNLNGAGKSGYGWGDHGNVYALRNDYTAQSHIATRWKSEAVPETGPKTGTIKKGAWAPTLNPLSVITPFRGDKVSVIDFGQRNKQNIYKWRPSTVLEDTALGALINNTQDFIKFYFTGPKLHAGLPKDDKDTKDDVIVFRAIINSLSDTFTPGWSSQPMIGRADPNYHYTGFTRDMNLDFTVYATSRDELKPIYRKLNALAGYTAPEYVKDSIAMRAPWMRMTIGDLFVQQPVILTSLGYTLHDSDTTWEINFEDDPTMMQTPHKIGVSMGITPIMDYLPQKGGKFYTLAKKFDAEAIPKPGNDNWLSEFDNQATWTEKEVDDWRVKHALPTVTLSESDKANISKIPLGT
jgi:hypothetical protein